MTIILLAVQAGLGSFLIKVLLMGLVLMAAAYLLNGVDIEDFTRAVIIAFVLAILNATLGAFLHFITAPLSWITLGLFSFVVDAIVLMIAAHFLKGFSIKSFSWAFLMAIFVAVANVFLHFS
jgi:putative membrane protein